MTGEKSRTSLEVNEAPATKLQKSKVCDERVNIFFYCFIDFKDKH